MISDKKSCCFTGHRIIHKEHIERLMQNIPLTIKALAAEGVTDFICGGALGFDTLAAQLVIAAKDTLPDIRLILALPCREQSKSWTLAAQKSYREILNFADETVYVSDEYYNGCMQKRNRFMVDNSSHCIFYMASPRGGTAYTVKYAIKNGLLMHNALTDFIK